MSPRGRAPQPNSLIPTKEFLCEVLRRLCTLGHTSREVDKNKGRGRQPGREETKGAKEASCKGQERGLPEAALRQLEFEPTGEQESHNQTPEGMGSSLT